jgi:O-methyltransferase
LIGASFSLRAGAALLLTPVGSPDFIQKMSTSAKELYIELLKKSLCFAIYEEPAIPVEFFWRRRGWIKQKLAPVLASLFGLMGAKLCFHSDYTRQDVEEGRIWPLQAHSMIGLKRMNNLCFCVRTVLKEGIQGDFIETGVWRGGACILMRGILAAYEVTDRKVFVADSFRGLPRPNEADYPADSGDRHHEQSFLAVSRQQVEDNFRRYELLDSQVVFLEGWFKDTLPNLPSTQLAVIRLDGDMYESTTDALRNLYPLLVPGGFCIIDDYFLVNCHKAVHDYREREGISEAIQKIDGIGVFWRKRRDASIPDSSSIDQAVSSK